jgi:hypothetical protein
MRQSYISVVQILLLAIIASLAMTSCEDALVKDLDIEDDLDFEQRLGLSGTIFHQFDGDPDFQVSGILLAESQSIIENPEEVVYYEGGELNVSNSSGVVGQFMELGDGRYIGVDPNTMLNYDFPAETYSVEVTHPSLGMVSATTTMPEPVYLTEITLDSIDVPESEFSDLTPFLVTMTFTDPPGENFYGFTIDRIPPNTEYFTVRPRLQQVNNPNLVWLNSDLVVFTDEIFEDSEYTISFYIDISVTGAILSDLTIEQIKSQLRIVWSCFSEDRYRFDISYDNFVDSSDLGPFFEPVSLYNNVENGLGYFGAANYYIAEFDN